MKLKLEIDLEKIPANDTKEAVMKMTQTLKAVIKQIDDGDFDIMFTNCGGFVTVDLVADGNKVGKMKVV